MEKQHKETDRIPTGERLAQILELAQAPTEMIQRARANYYDEYKSVHPMPIYALVQDALRYHLVGIAERAKNGEFDAQRWEAEEWGKSEEAQEIFREIMNPKTKRNKRRR